MKALIILACLAIVSMASAAYTPAQHAMYDGTRLSWKMAVAYTNQDTNAYNALVDQWNAWVYQNFGQDPALLMSKMAAPVNLQKPYVSANNTTTGIVHSIDGNRWQNKTYTTNDMNLLPASVTEKMYKDSQKAAPGSAAALAAQGNYLGGV